VGPTEESEYAVEGNDQHDAHHDGGRNRRVLELKLEVRVSESEPDAAESGD
jgi:hypothetical protein